MSRAGRRVIRILLPLFCVAAVAWVLISLDPARVAAIAVNADPLWLLLSFLPLLARFVIWTFKWWAMIRRRAPIPFIRTLRGVMAGTFINLITPTAKMAGGLYRAAFLRGLTGWRFASAMGWTITDQGSNLAGNVALYGVLALGAGMWMPSTGAGIALQVSGAGALLLFVTALLVRPLVWRKLSDPRCRTFLTRWLPARIRSTGNEDDGWLTASMAPTLRDRAGWRETVQDVGLTVLSWAALCVSNAMVFRALGVDAPFLQVAAILVLGGFAGTFTGAGGVGVTEVTLIALYLRLGIDEPAAVAGALLHRASLYLTILLVGGWSLIREGAGGYAGRKSESAGDGSGRPIND